MGQLKYRRVQRTSLIALGCAAFLSSLWVARYGWLPLAAWPWLVVAGGLLVLCLQKRAMLAVPAVVGAATIGGLVIGSSFAARLAAYQPILGSTVAISGEVVDDANYNDKGQLDFRLGQVVCAGHSLPGRIRVTSYDFLKPHRGDHVEVTGKLYNGFGNYQAAIYYASVHLVSHNTSWLEAARRAFSATVYSHLPDPQASLGLGFLVGTASPLPSELSDQMRLVGLTHIVVASGYNLTILIRLARRLFEKRSKYQAVLVSVLLTLGFVAITGVSPSMSRAALVTCLSLAAWYYGRQISPVVILVIAAAITAGINPLYLWTDLGWWLSFLAFAGVLIVAPLIEARLFAGKRPKLIGQVLIETVSAQLVTTPIIIATFGTLAVLALPANLLVVPFVPLAMLLTFVAGGAGIVAPWLAPYVAMPATWLLTYMTQLVSSFAAVSWASIHYVISPLVMIGSYTSMAIMTWFMRRRTDPQLASRNIIE